jgi:predicted O-methyltransferase YrrM
MLVLAQYARGYLVSKALQAAAELNIADLLKDSPKDCEELARLTSTHAPSLYRLLRALAGFEIFQEDEQGRFANTALSEPLRSDVPNSIRDHVIYISHDGNVRAWMHFMETLQTGKSSFQEVNGLPLWEYLPKHPDLEEHFDRSMTQISRMQCEEAVSNCDLSDCSSVLDIGGGQGMLLAKILQAYPQLHGAIFERDSVAERAKQHLAEQGIAERSKIISGSFLETVPSGYDTYVMKQVLHNWNDEKAGQILGRCRRAMPEHGKLIIFETVIMPGNEPHPSKWFDLHMLVILGGKERTAKEFDSLLAQAGFRMTKAIQAETIGIVEAVPV